MLISGKNWNYLKKHYSLTLRELQILKLVCKPLIDEDIARQLGITKGTVKTHLRNAYSKLHIFGPNRRMRMFVMFLEKLKKDNFLKG